MEKFPLNTFKRGSLKKNFFEHLLWPQGKTLIGIDEVGRGCLAGPVVTAAVTILGGKSSRLLKDSKVLCVEDREKAYTWIVKNCHFTIGLASHEEVDQLNIWHATLRAMRQATLNLLATCLVKPAAILVDAMPLNLVKSGWDEIPVHYFPKGESLSSSIAAASIVAKVTRDRLMQTFDTLLPAYQLSRHKGYATKGHTLAIQTHRHSIIHRLQFLKGIPSGDALKKESSYAEQQCIC